jgi:hypothetical protein
LRWQQAVGNRAVARIVQALQPSATTRHAAARTRTPADVRTRWSRAADVIQRDIGVEFQARNVISKNKGKKKFERTETKAKPLRRVGDLTLEVDTGSVMEFGTGHHKVWSQLKKELDAVTGIITEITGLPQEPLNPAKPVTVDNPLVFRGFKSDHGKVDVTANPANFFGKPQTNEEIVLSDFGRLCRPSRDRKAEGSAGVSPNRSAQGSSCSRCAIIRACRSQTGWTSPKRGSTLPRTVAPALT